MLCHLLSVRTSQASFSSGAKIEKQKLPHRVAMRFQWESSYKAIGTMPGTSQVLSKCHKYYLHYFICKKHKLTQSSCRNKGACWKGYRRTSQNLVSITGRTDRCLGTGKSQTPTPWLSDSICLSVCHFCFLLHADSWLLILSEHLLSQLPPSLR